MLLTTPLQAGDDVELPIVVRHSNRNGDVIPASDFTKAVLSLYTADRVLVLTKELNTGIVVEDVDGESLFIVTFDREDTTNFEGLYLIQFIVEDSTGLEGTPVNNEITFKPKLGV